MRIGIDCRLWNETGVGRYVRNLVLQLHRIDKKNEYVLFVREKDIKEIRYLVSDERFRVVSVDILWHSVREQLSFAAVLTKEDLDLMHFPYFSLPILYRRPFVVTVHDLIIHQFSTGKASTLPLPLYQLKRFGFKRVLSHALKHAEKIIVPLHAVEDDLTQKLHIQEERIVVTPEGFDTTLKTTTRPAYAEKLGRYFLYVGNIYPHKNVRRLIQAFEIARKKEPQIQLVLVGKEDYFYRQLKKEVGGGNHGILFYHNVPDSELSYLYKNAVALVSPSLMEGFGLPALEALSLSCLPVVSKIPAFMEVCQKHAIYFDPEKSDDIAGKLLYTLSMRGTQRQALLRESDLRVKEFSWEKMARMTKQIYESSTRIRPGK